GCDLILRSLDEMWHLFSALRFVDGHELTEQGGTPQFDRGVAAGGGNGPAVGGGRETIDSRRVADQRSDLLQSARTNPPSECRSVSTGGSQEFTIGRETHRGYQGLLVCRIGRWRWRGKRCRRGQFVP